MRRQNTYENGDGIRQEIRQQEAQDNLAFIFINAIKEFLKSRAFNSTSVHARLKVVDDNQSEIQQQIIPYLSHTSYIKGQWDLTLGVITDMHARVDEATAAVSKSIPTPAATSPTSKAALSKPATNKASPQIKLQMFSGNSLE